MLTLQERANLITLYNEPQRHYHTLEHIHNCLIEYQQYCLSTNTTQDDKIIYAIWWHDAIYMPKSSTNEEDSANLFTISSVNLNYNFTYEVKEMILCSKHHKPNTELEKIFCDIDMSILGYFEKEYQIYYEQIRKEYSFVKPVIYSLGRQKFIKTLLGSEKIYNTDYFYNKYEKQARINLENELVILSKIMC